VIGARAAGAALLTAMVSAAAAAPILAPNSPTQQFGDYENAPPMVPRIFDGSWRPVRPFVYPIKLIDRLERRYAEDRGRRAPLLWLEDGRLVSIDRTDGPLLLLGSDPLGRDVLARVLHGARLSLGVAWAGSIGAILLGLLVGGLAGFLGGRSDTVLMTLADFVLILPAIYVVLAFRAALPLVLSGAEVFAALTAVLVAAGWPLAARAVRAIVAGERRKEYAEAAYALGADRWRILRRHLLPATAPTLLVLWTMMLPAFVLTESTMSLVGLGFPVPAASWGTMLRDAWQGGAFTDAPWLMTPAVALVVTVLSLQLLASGRMSGGPRAGTFS
jgi:peptide/nickel transport system permease protein